MQSKVFKLKLQRQMYLLQNHSSLGIEHFCKLSTLINYFEPSASGGNPGERSYVLSSNWDKGLLFTGQVGYKEMVYLEGSYRRDWYRAFKQFEGRGTPDNYGYFSVGANALLHQMMPMPEAITNLKIRASYSEVGNSIPNILFTQRATDPITGSVTPSPYGYFENPCRFTENSTARPVSQALFKKLLSSLSTHLIKIIKKKIQ